MLHGMTDSRVNTEDQEELAILTLAIDPINQDTPTVLHGMASHLQLIFTTLTEYPERKM